MSIDLEAGLPLQPVYPGELCRGVDEGALLILLGDNIPMLEGVGLCDHVAVIMPPSCRNA